MLPKTEKNHSKKLPPLEEEEYGPADDGLYYDCSQVRRRERKLTFIPYYAWANRNEGEMTVWVND